MVGKRSEPRVHGPSRQEGGGGDSAPLGKLTEEQIEKGQVRCCLLDGTDGLFVADLFH